MDVLVYASKVPCVYKIFGNERYFDQHSLAEHSSICVHAPYYCYECTSPFWGSPASLVHHLTQPSVDHYWPAAVNIKYETCYPFAVPKSLEDHRRLLVSKKDGSRYVGAHTASITLTGTVPSCSVLADVDMEDAWYDFPPKMVHGDSKKVHLDICINKLNVDH
ncbi:uncharacterized protein [Aegilops tauschii subsp. strangulata]|uniref:uncharacterized protein n=1 Tax=Aegilops tauschii subsp. strangulata TaxID=200361 RepID=UPI001ABD3555|nr:uncharacterized protein LOC120963300 [Aegilops tauschii subsp. strangulata]